MDGNTISDIAVGPSGDIWVVGSTTWSPGSTTSIPVPTTPDALIPAAPGGPEGFLARLRPDGTVAYRTYLGGSGPDAALAVALDAAGNVYVAGRTVSNDFPTTAGAFDRSCADGHCGETPEYAWNGFVMKLTPAGTSIVYSTFFGGSKRDSIHRLAVDAAGRVHMVGETTSIDFPLTADAAQATRLGNADLNDGFYSRLSADGSTLEYSTYMGGSGSDHAYDVAVDSGGNAYVVGAAASSDFIIRNALQTYGGGWDAWLARFTDAGLQYSTFFGGSQYDEAYGVALSGEGVYLSGSTTSCEFPGASRPASSSICTRAAYIAKVRLDGTAGLRTTLLSGSSGTTIAYGLEVDAEDNVFATGSTNAPDFPVTADAFQTGLVFGTDAFFAVVPMAHGASGVRSYATYLGGQGFDEGHQVAVDASGSAVIGGRTGSSDFPAVNGTQTASGPPTATAFVARFIPAAAPPSSPTDEIVLHASDGSIAGGGWQLVADATAAGGQRLWNPNAGVPKLASASAIPSGSVDFSFQAEAGKPYHLWLRMKADADHWTNDSVFVQFSDTVDTLGRPVWRIGTTSATVVSLEDCTNCGESGWGWNDNGYATFGQHVIFAESGTHVLRIQQREDGISVDQIVLSSATWLQTPPGSAKNDTTIVPKDSPPPDPTGSREVVLYAAQDVLPGNTNWVVVSDPTAAAGARLWNPNRNLPKASSPLAGGADYFELEFAAEVGVAYRLWIRGKAEGDAYYNDSVFVQFSDSADAGGAARWRIGTTDAFTVVLEDCESCGTQGWGWQDNGWNGLGPEVYFSKAGTQKIRILRREDGVSIDQVVLSAGRYLTQSPGVLKNDTTIIPR
jgi:hypothetical protein